MSQLKLIRQELGMSQAELAKKLQRSQGSICAYEKGQDIPQRVAQNLVQIASARGLSLTFDHVYGVAPLPSAANAEA